MKTTPITNKGKADKDKTEIKTDGPLSEKDEVKQAEDKMREAQKKLKK